MDETPTGVFDKTNNPMNNLNQLLEDNFERVSDNLYAEWLFDNQREPSTLQGMFRSLGLSHLYNDLMEAQEQGLVSLVVDDRSLVVEVLWINQHTPTSTGKLWR